MRVSAKSAYALLELIEIATRDDGAPVSAEELVLVVDRNQLLADAECDGVQAGSHAARQDDSSHDGQVSSLED